MTLSPAFQAQNPAISGYRYGWSSCTAFSAAMTGSYDAQVRELVTGGQVREETGDHVGGLSLAQVDDSLEHWSVFLDVRYRLPWADFATRVTAGRMAILQGGYGPIADSPFDAGGGFRGNHAIAVYPGFVVMDPLADGRRDGIYKYHGEAYPADLLRRFAGALNLGGSLLGNGLTYAAFSHDRLAPVPAEKWVATVRPAGTQFMRYFVAKTQYGLQIRGREKRTTKAGFSLPCTAPKNIWENAGAKPPTSRRSIVEVAGPGPGYDNFWIDSKWAEEK